MRSLIFIITVALTIAFSTPLFSSSKVLEVEGQIQSSLEQELQEGRWELVMFWATYCHVCKKDFKKIAGFIEENDSIPLTIVGVVTDGMEEKVKTNALIAEHNLDYTHILTDYPKSNELYQNLAGQRLVGTPSYLLYNPQNELVAFNANAIDLDALEIFVYE